MTWISGSTLFVLYIVCLFTVCMVTFRKGYTALGIFGIIFPFLWLFGAIMPPKPGSAYDMEDRARLAVS